MKNNHKLLMGGVALSLFCSAPAYSQEGFVLEEITVTARKREESLTEVPVSISVLGESLIKDAGILTQQDLFALTPGIHYDEAIDRNSALPSVRGVQSNEIATNRTKVTAFIDGMPVLGSQGNVQFGSVAQVEVYRGPQSAAFGRSTFGGAINYVTKDPGEELEGSVNVDVDDYGKRILGGSYGGPITDKLGFLVDFNVEDSSSPDEFTASDGLQYGERTSESFGAKLVFAPNEALEMELSFTHVESDDAPSVEYFISEAARNNCWDGTVVDDMGDNLIATGELDCDWSQGASIQAQNDRTIAIANDANGYGYTGQDLEDALFIAESQSVDGRTLDEKDRLQFQMDYSREDGSLIQVSAFYGEEDYVRGNDGSQNSGEGTTGEALAVVGGAGAFEVVGMGMGATSVGTIMSDPTQIEEQYLEVRWVSPAENRLRYVVGGSYYDYDFLTTLYFGGYGAVQAGDEAVQRYLDLTGVDVTVANQIFSESATNIGAFFNASYDLTENLTVTAEGRYQSDDVGGTDSASGESDNVVTKAFLPRLSFNYAIDEDTSFYGQIAKGNNPAGVNVGLFHPEAIANLDNGIPDGLGVDTPAGIDTNAACTGSDADIDNDDCRSRYVTYGSDTYVNFEEETLINYELGFKGTAFDGRFTYATAIFFMDWQDQTQTLNLDWGDPEADGADALEFTTNRTQINEGDLEMKGIEFEGSYRISEGFSIRGQFSYLSAEYKDFCSLDLVGSLLDTDASRFVSDPVSGETCYDVSGFDVEQQPAWSGSLSPSFNGNLGDSNLRWNARADIRFSDSEYLDATNVTETTAYTTMNLSAGLSAESWDVTLYINNATDNDTPLRYDSDDDFTIDQGVDSTPTGLLTANGVDNHRNILITPRQQRTIGLRAAYRF